MLDSLRAIDSVAYSRMLDSLRIVKRIQDSLDRVNAAKTADSLKRAQEEWDRLSAIQQDSLRRADSLKKSEEIAKLLQKYPSQVKTVVGHGYDITGRYAHISGIRGTVLDLGELAYLKKIEEDKNVLSLEAVTVAGSSFSDYQTDRIAKTNVSVKASASFLVGSASFSGQYKTDFNSSVYGSNAHAFGTVKYTQQQIGYKVADEQK